MKKTVLIALLLTNIQTVSADGLGWQFEAAAEMGGDKFAKVFYTNGKTQDIETGQGLTLAIGGHYRAKQSPWEFVGTIGYKFVTTAASNVDITLTRNIVKGEVRYHINNDFWLGTGITQHSNIKFDCGGLCPDEDLQNANGILAVVGWKWMGLTFNKMDYQDRFGYTYNADNVGLIFSAGF